MLMALGLLTPLVAALVILWASRLSAAGPAAATRRAATMLAPAAVLPAILLCLLAPAATLEVPWLLMGTSFAMDAPARALTLIAALLYGAALLTLTWTKARQNTQPSPGTAALSGFLLVCFIGNIGTYLAADTATFYLSFTLMSFSAAGLVIHYRTPTAHRATRIYLILSVASETAILAALILITAAGGYQLTEAQAATGTSPNTGLIVILLLIGFGVKAGTVPLHVWLLLAHPAAPPVASAVLSGAMVKAGLIGWIRFLPLGETALPTAGWVLLSLALLGAFAAAVIGVLQQDPKVVLAYSTISQMGFITVLVAVALLVPEAAEVATSAAVLYAVHHGLAKGALFLGVPVAEHYGRGRTGVLVVIGMAGAGLAVAGAPLTSGAFGKYVSKEAVEGVAIPLPAGASLGVEHVLPLVATGSTVLLMRFAWVMLHRTREPIRTFDGELTSWLAVCAAGMVVPWWVGNQWLHAGEFSWEPGALWDASWPILLGLGLGVTVWWQASRGWLSAWMSRADGTAVPPGDLIEPEESLLVRLARWTTRGLDRSHAAAGAVGAAGGGVITRGAEAGRNMVMTAESRVAPWPATGVVILLVAASAVVLVMMGWNR